MTGAIGDAVNIVVANANSAESYSTIADSSESRINDYTDDLRAAFGAVDDALGAGDASDLVAAQAQLAEANTNIDYTDDLRAAAFGAVDDACG